MSTKAPLHRLNSLYVCTCTYIYNIHVHICETVIVEEAVSLKGSRKGDLAELEGKRRIEMI